MSIKSKVQALIDAANATTGETDLTLTAAIQTLIDGFGGGGGSGLPDEYQAVEYIQAQKTGEYIATGLTELRTGDTFKVETHFFRSVSPDYTESIFSNNTQYRGICKLSAGKVKIESMYNSPNIEIAQPDANVKTLLIAEWGDTLSLTVGETTQTAEASSKPFNGEITIFKNTVGGTQKSSCGIYDFKIYTDKLVRDFVPCVRKSDGAIGLYDKCKSICSLTNTPFYINAADVGGFLAGGNV